MKLTDVIAQTLINYGIRQAYGLQGGAVAHIFDSLEKAGVNVTYTLHEQAASLAGPAYAKASSNIGCVVTTTGPGSTNAITGLLGAWNDSTPCLFISGQVRSNHVSYGKKVRQVGTQEAPIREIVKPLTKSAKFIEEPELFQEELEDSIQIAMSGRPGPVWIDIPLEYQWLDIPFQPRDKVTVIETKSRVNLNNFYHYISNSKKPLLILGNGIHLSQTEDECRNYLRNSRIPFVTTWTAQDLAITCNPYNLGVIGMCGQKGANKAVFDADLLICLGTHLSIPHTTTLYDDFAPNAKKILVNCDEDQIINLNIRFDLIIKGDLRDFFSVVKSNNSTTEWKCHLYKSLNWYKIKSEK